MCEAREMRDAYVKDDRDGLDVIPRRSLDGLSFG